MENYGLKYNHKFRNRNNDLIDLEIFQKGFNGDAEVLKIKSNSIVISENERELTDNLLIGSGCKFTVINDGEFTRFNELFGVGRFDNYVVIRKDNEYLFEGFIIPEIYNQNIKSKSEIEFTASNQIKQLSKIETNVLDNTFNNYVNLIDVIKDIVWSTELKNDIYIKNTIYNELYTEYFDVSITLYDELYVDKQIFVGKDSYEILNMILLPTYSRLYYYNKKWIIERIKDIKEENRFKVYHYDNTESVEVLNSSLFDLDDINKVFNANSVSYVAGCGRYELDLNIQHLENLVINNFEDIRYTETFTEKDVEFLYVPFVGVPQYGTYTNVLPLPKRNEWGVNTQAIQFFGNSMAYSDENISNGLQFLYNKNYEETAQYPLPQIFTTMNIEDFFAITTKLIIDWNIPQSLNINYKNSVYRANSNSKYRSRFALRYYNEVNDTSKYIYIDEEDDNKVKISNFYRCFETVSEGKDIVSNGRLFEVNKSINIGYIMLQLKQELNLQNVVELYIDFFMLEQQIDNENAFKPMRTQIGDFVVTTESNLTPNSYLCDLPDVENYNTKTIELDLYDYSSVGVANSLLVKDDNNNFVLTRRWLEYRFSGKKDIQTMLLTDLIQLYNKNRYKLSTELIFNDFTNLKYNDIFKYTGLDNYKEFVITGKHYNVQNNSYRLQLQEYVDDDGYYLIEDFDVSDPEYIDKTPSTGIQDEGYGGSYMYVIDSNVAWEVIVEDEAKEYITVTPKFSFGMNRLFVTLSPYYVYEEIDEHTIVPLRTTTILIKSEEAQNTISVEQLPVLFNPIIQ